MWNEIELYRCYAKYNISLSIDGTVPSPGKFVCKDYVFGSVMVAALPSTDGIPMDFWFRNQGNMRESRNYWLCEDVGGFTAWATSIPQTDGIYISNKQHGNAVHSSTA